MKSSIVVDQVCNREKNWTISDSKDAIAEWWTEDDLHRHKNHSCGTVGWAIPSASGSASRSTNQRRDGTSSLWCWSERETNQAWLLVLVGWVTPTASFTTHLTDAKTASSEQWKRTESTRRAIKYERSLFNDDNHSYSWLSDGEGVMNVALNSSTSILTWLVAPKTTSIDQKTDSHHES